MSYHKNWFRFSCLATAWVLSGCAAAAIPLTAAEIGVGGYEAYKLVQTSEGGSVGVSFPQKDGKDVPPQPLPAARRVAIWPGGEHERYLAEKLTAAKRFEVVTPDRVRVVLAAAKVSPDIRDLTEAEQISALSAVCKKTKVDLVLAARDGGSVSHANSLSFSAADKVTTSDLLTFSCQQHAVVWRDEMKLKVEIGDKTPSTEAIAKVGGDAWADRVIAAETASSPMTQVGQAY